MDVTREEFVDRASALVPALRERAATAEQDRRMSKETHKDFLAADLYRIFQPKRFGGYEMDLGLMVDVACEVGRGCGSSAWNLTNIAVQGWIQGMHLPEVQEEVWADNPKALIASSFPGKGSSVKWVDGGLVVDGLWSFASGVDFADWNNLQIFVPREGGPPDHYFGLVPKSEFEIVDDWFVTGLAATGSRSIKLSKVFIPERRLQFTSNIKGGDSPGSAINPSTLYKLPVFSVGLKHFSGSALGIARGGIELVEEDMLARKTVTGMTLAEQPSVWLRIAEAGAQVDAAWALLLKDCIDAERMLDQGHKPSVEQCLKWRRNDAYAGRLAVNAIEHVYSLAGGRGLSSGSAFQRAWKDVHAAVQQMLMSWDMHALNYGKVRMGQPFSDPRV